MNLFYTLKLNTSYIIDKNYKVNIEFNQAKRDGYIVSLGDNQLLKFIRQIKSQTFDANIVDELYVERNRLKQSKEEFNSEKIIDIQNQINELLFVPDILSVKVDTTKRDYKYLCKHGFSVKVKINQHEYEIHYRKLCAGAGQLRRNSAIFVNEKLMDLLEPIMMCGLNRRRIGKINLSKFSAYYALYTSATNQVKTPRICVVKDLEYMLHDQKASWIYEKPNGDKDIEDKQIDFKINAFDGSGMISVSMAEKWQENLGLDYMPSSFIIRSAWIKGLVSVFDFHKFAKEIAHQDVIVDAWGNEKNVNDIDVILTISQFKMWKRYTSWEEYIFYHYKYNHIFGVARVAKKENNFLTPLNYQYIQSNNFTVDTIKKLADFTVDWVQKIMSGDRLYTMLFLMGCQDDTQDSDNIENKLNSSFVKAMMYDERIINDPYVRRKINQMIETKVRQMKIGKLFVEGSYDFAIPDLYALSEHAFGMEVHGLLKEKQCWNKRWVDKGSTVVTLMRSPLVSPSENQLMNIYSDDKCLEWFQYIKSGNIMNIWDMAMIVCSDADKSLVRFKNSEPTELGVYVTLGIIGNDN